MRHLFIMAILLMTSLVAPAQKETLDTVDNGKNSVCADIPKTIETFSANSHETEWYGVQTQAWQKVVDENPRNEWAWRNLFRATYYYDMFTDGFGDDQNQSKTADVLRKIEAAFPDSYVLNLCKGRFCLTTDSAALRGDNIFRAIELMPEDANDEDVAYLASRLWVYDPENRKITELNKRIYEQGYYPERTLKYNWNMLQSMELNALYFAYGDNITKPMKMLQDALDMRLDVVVIPMSYLYVDKFRNVLYKRLGIKPMKVDFTKYSLYGEEGEKQFYTDMMMYLIRESKRPAYFSGDVLTYADLNKDSIYNEGLLLKWNDRQYDNFAVAMHNVKDVYHLDYLAEPDLHPNKWETSYMLDLNNVTLLANLISKLRNKGEISEANRLRRILEECIERCPNSPEYKQCWKKAIQEDQ